MRTIKFRGKRVDNGEWVYGNLIEDKYIVGKVIDWSEDYFNTEFWWEVIPESVGQFTESVDRNNKEIYECDILSLTQFDVINYKVIVEFINYSWILFNSLEDIITLNHALWRGDLYSFEVVGNIHDNKELLNETK